MRAGRTPPTPTTDTWRCCWRGRPVTLADHLRAAPASQSVIDQAIGIVMAQRHCSAGNAIATLRTISQQRHIKLRTVAADLVTAIAPPVRASSR